MGRWWFHSMEERMAPLSWLDHDPWVENAAGDDWTYVFQCQEDFDTPPLFLPFRSWQDKPAPPPPIRPWPGAASQTVTQR